MKTEPLSETLSLKEAAAMIGIGMESMRSLILDGEIPAVSLNHKHMVLLRSDVISFVRDTARRQQSDRLKKREQRERASMPKTENARGKKKAMPDLSGYATKVA